MDDLFMTVCFKEIVRCSKMVSRKFQGVFNSVSRIFQGKFKGLSRKFCRVFKRFSRMFKSISWKCFKSF